MLEKLFHTPIYRTKFHDLELIHDICKNELQSIKFIGDSKKFQPQDSVTGGLHPHLSYKERQSHSVHNIGRFKTISDFIETESQKYWQQLEYYTDTIPKINMSWIVINRTGGYNQSHHHGNNPLACAFYLDATPDQGNLVFENPLEPILIYQPYKNKKWIYEIEVQTGDLVIFPGYLKHFTTPNLTDRPRVAMGCNLE